LIRRASFRFLGVMASRQMSLGFRPVRNAWHAYRWTDYRWPDDFRNISEVTTSEVTTKVTWHDDWCHRIWLRTRYHLQRSRTWLPRAGGLGAGKSPRFWAQHDPRPTTKTTTNHQRLAITIATAYKLTHRRLCIMMRDPPAQTARLAHPHSQHDQP
jgi:hypothetical protein